MLSPKAKQEFASLVEQTKEERQRVRRLVSQRRWGEAEPDQDRLMRYAAKKRSKVRRAGAESFQGPTHDLQGVSFLTEGARMRRTVAFVLVNAPTYASVGSGFLVSSRLFLTNQHVIRDADAARGTLISFDHETDEAGAPSPLTTYHLDPDTFALFSDEDKLDYALVAVGRLNSGVGVLGDFGCCALSDTSDRHVIGMSVNIIQHPRGRPKMVSVRNNPLTFRTPNTLLYETDTDEGSSGSPVFNDDWELVALHHWGQPFLENRDDQGRPIPTTVNEGVRISAIYHDLQSRMGTLTAAQQEMLRQAFAKPATPAVGDKVLTPPRPRPAGSETTPPETVTAPKKGTDMGKTPESNELRVTLPIEIIVRVGAASAAGVEILTGVTPEPPGKTLTPGSEALKIDKDYDNRRGYDADFIDGFVLQLPQPQGQLAKQVAPLRPSEPNAAEGELKYEHFSIKMDKSKRMAMFTATNIDGETYLTVSRDTGQVTGGPEAETWFKDPRISDAFFIGQSFYSAWSDFFDRGHLTRRIDPTWGTETEAERANADTYHFTNCSPQHFRFNQTTKYWQGVERYVLENGLFDAGTKKRLCVYQGPIFDDKIDHLAADVQIPSSFFKIVVWKGQNGLKAVGLVVDQLALLSEKRKNLGPPRDVPFVDVSQWRVAVSQIEKRTGLKFDPEIRQADTIQAGDQPLVGAEAARPIRSFEDLLA